MKQEFSPYFVIYMDLSLGFVTWICLNLNSLLAVTGVMHEADMLTQSGAPGRVIGWTNFSH